MERCYTADGLCAAQGSSCDCFVPDTADFQHAVPFLCCMLPSPQRPFGRVLSKVEPYVAEPPAADLRFAPDWAQRATAAGITTNRHFAVCCAISAWKSLEGTDVGEQAPGHLQGTAMVRGARATQRGW